MKVHTRKFLYNHLVVIKISKQAHKAVALIISFLSSRLFFWLVIGFFLFQALWIVFSFMHPMLYDEAYHFGIIKFFSNTFWPIVVGQPEKYDEYRDIGREGSYLFHYLMSYPYRLASYLTNNPIYQILFLRVLNVALFTLGLLTFAKLFKTLGVRRIFINVSLLFFVLLPITPFIAATINYDNLLFLVTATFLLLSVRAIIKKQSDLTIYLLIASVGVIGSLVKFAFVPIFITGIVFIIINFLYKFRRFAWREAKRLFLVTNKTTLIVLSILLGLFSVWFLYIHGTNLVKYHHPVPKCQQTMSLERCKKSTLVERNIILEESTHLREAVPYAEFSTIWFNQMLAYISWTGVAIETDGKFNISEKPLPVVHYTIYLLMVWGLVFLIYAWGQFSDKNSYRFLAVILVVYFLFIFAVNASYYYRFHQLIATQPRYLLILVPVLMLFMVLAFNSVLAKQSRALKLLLLFIATGFMLNGGGLTTHLVRSNENWYWQNDMVIELNLKAKEVIDPVIVED